MANYAGLLFNGQEVSSSKVFSVLPPSVIPEWHTPPLSVLAVTCSQKDKETCFDPIKHPEKQEAEAKSNPKPRESQTKPPIPTSSNLRSAITPVWLTPQAFNLQPPTINTKDAFKNHWAVPLKTKDIVMKDTYTKAKSTPSYHFMSDIQEMYDLDKII